MTAGKTGEAEETCGRQSGSGASSTALSTIAVQAGLTHIVASVLKSGSLVHLQLVQFQPGLCEIGWNREENLILIQELQPLLGKLQKREPEALAVVEEKRQETLRMRRDGRRKQREEEEEEEELTEAMKASLSEGWSLLLQLLDRRLEVLKLASDFFLRATEFTASIDRLEDLQIKAGEDKLNEAQVSYDFMRKDLLGKSLQVLTSSSVLLHRLRQLQRTEALQRRGGVLQAEEAEAEECSQYSRGPVLRLEELVEALQDRRRRADQAFRLQLQQAESHNQDQNLLHQNLQFSSTSDQSDDLEREETSEPKELKSGSTPDLQSKQRHGKQPKDVEDVKLEAGSRLQESGQELDVKPDSWSELNSDSRLDEISDEQDELKSSFRSAEATKTRLKNQSVSLGSAAQSQPRSASEKNRTLPSESSSHLQTGSSSHLQTGSSSHLQSESSSHLQTGSSLDLNAEPGSQNTRDLESGFRSDNRSGSDAPRSGSKEEGELRRRSGSENTKRPQLEPKAAETRNLWVSFQPVLKTRSRLDELFISESDVKPGSRSEETTNLPSESGSGLKTEQDSKNPQTGLVSEPENRAKSELRRSGSKEPEDLRSASVDARDSLPESSSQEQHTSAYDGKTGSTSDDTRTRKLGSRSEEMRVQFTGSGPEGIRNLKLQSQSENISEQPRSAPEKPRNHLKSPGSSSAGTTDLQTGAGSEPKNQSRSDEPRSQEGTDLRSEDLKTETSSALKAGSRSDERKTSDGKPGSEEAKTQQTGSRPEVCGTGSVLHLDGTEPGSEQQEQEGERIVGGYQERLMKAQQDLQCVSELLDFCTRMDLGSELQTARLLERFRRAEPHFRQLDAEVEHTARSWESQRGVKGGAGMEGDPSELLKLQQTVKDKIQQSESILKLSSSFHVTAAQLEVLLQSEPTAASAGQIQSLLKASSTAGTDIVAALSETSWGGFQVEQLQRRLASLDSLCESWLNGAAQREEEELRREQLTHLLQEDITQLRESFKELKKRFSNTKFNYLKRNDRTRNPKAAWNQLQQMEAYQEKLQALRKRVHAAAARSVPEVKNSCAARRLEDSVNELQRQMGQLDKNLCEHQKTLDMTCRLQQALEEYQFWCEEASATIARVGKFSLECRSTEAVSVLYRQFEKFVWPTVPQQEERIGQITELAVRLHGVEEGQRYIEKTVSKHSEMVESIRELSDGLMELEAKLKLESLKQEQKDEGMEEEEEGQRERRRQTEEQEKTKGKRRMKQRDNRSTQEAADMNELKETGHTPELMTENDRKEAAAANRRPPLEKSQEVNGPTAGRESNDGKFTSSFTICSPVEAKRQAQAPHNQSLTVAMETKAPPSQSLIGPSFPDNQEEFHKEMEEAEQHMASGLQDLNQPEVMSDDEYDCPSPDDISLPPLAETPDSHMFQSDVEEGFCFSSHSVHVSHQCHAQSEPAGADPVPGQTEGCPPPTVSQHSSTRVRSESRSFNPSPSTVPVATLFTSTLCTTLKTKESSSLDNPVHGDNTAHCSRDKDAPKKRSPSTSPTKDLSGSLHPQSCKGSDTGLLYHNIPKGDAGVLNFSQHYIKTDNILPEKRPESHHGSGSQNQDMTSINDSRKAMPERGSLTKTSTSLVSQQNIYIKSSFAGSHGTISKVCINSALESTFNTPSDPLPKSEPSPQKSSVADPVRHQDLTRPQHNILLEPSTTIPQSTTTTHQDPTLSRQKSTKTRNEPEQGVPSPVRDGGYRTTTTVTQQSVFNQRSPTDTTSNQHPRDPPEDPVHSPINNISICSSNLSLQTVYRLQESLTSGHTQQCVHDPSMSPGSAQPAPQTHASPHQPNPHASPPCSPPHLLTPSQDPEICVPTAVREEIRLTPQIQGPPLPPDRLRQPPSGKAPCFTRPRSRATVMEGSPVTLEVEVMGNPEPRLTRFKPEASPCGPNQNQGWSSSLQDSSSSSAGGGALSEAFDVITEDWDVWFGTLCVLLWLLCLVLL